MAVSTLKHKRRFNFRGSLSIPYLVFMAIFVILPLLLIVYYAFTDDNGSFNWFSNWQVVLSDITNWKVIGSTLLISALTTAFCLLIAYPIAMILSNSKFNKNKILVYAFLLPMWINFVIRTLALKALINNMSNTIFGISLSANAPYVAIVLGMVYDYLPFAILPLYNQMLKMDKNQLEAASDLGANPVQVFFKNIIPMTLPGIISASTMTFMPTMSSYVIVNYMSGNTKLIIGNLIKTQFDYTHYNLGSVLSLLMLIMISLFVVIEALSGKKNKQKGGIF